MKAIISRFLGALFPSTVHLLAALPTIADYEYHIGPRQTLTHLSVPTEIPSGVKAVYASYVRALDILGLSVDGSDVQPVTKFTSHEYLPADQVELHSKTYLYWFPIEEGIWWCPSPQELGALRKGSYAELPADTPGPRTRFRVLQDCSSIKLPSTWRSLRLRYRIRFPDGTRTREMSLAIIRRSDD